MLELDQIIRASVKKCIRQVSFFEDIDETLSFIYRLNVDSLDMVEIVTNLEKEFKVTIPDKIVFVPNDTTTIKEYIDYYTEVIQKSYEKT
jgi:acyl carrier protein